jgi:hypothetical protein
MLRFLLEHTPVKRLARGAPIVGLLSVAEVAKLASDHLAKLDGAERRRLLALAAKARHGSAALNASERRELASLVTKLQPRAFIGSAANRFSPVPMPKRLLYGRRGGDARKAADERP